MSKRRYYTLDGLRGVGAIAVVFLHFNSAYGLPVPVHAYLAVDMFFCLSGFVLTRGYSDKLASGLPFEKWVIVRLRRLYPLFFLSMVVALPLTSLEGFPGSELTPSLRLVAFGSGVLMLPSPTWTTMSALFPLNFVAWSLLIEMLLSLQFYWSARASNKVVWGMLALGLIGLLVLRFTVGKIDGGYAWKDAPIGIIRGLYSFSAGMLIARYANGKPVVSRWAWVPLGTAAMMLSIRPPHGTAYDLLAIVIGFPLLVTFSVFLEPAKASTFKLSGDLSYPCYALHWPTFFALQAIFEFGPDEPAPMIAGAVAFTLFLIICHLLDRYYDAPLRAMKSRVISTSAQY